MPSLNHPLFGKITVQQAKEINVIAAEMAVHAENMMKIAQEGMRCLEEREAARLKAIEEREMARQQEKIVADANPIAPPEVITKFAAEQEIEEVKVHVPTGYLNGHKKDDTADYEITTEGDEFEDWITDCSEAEERKFFNSGKSIYEKTERFYKKDKVKFQDPVKEMLFAEQYKAEKEDGSHFYAYKYLTLTVDELRKYTYYHQVLNKPMYLHAVNLGLDQPEKCYSIYVDIDAKAEDLEEAELTIEEVEDAIISAIYDTFTAITDIEVDREPKIWKTYGDRPGKFSRHLTFDHHWCIIEAAAARAFYFDAFARVREENPSVCKFFDVGVSTATGWRNLRTQGSSKLGDDPAQYECPPLRLTPGDFGERFVIETCANAADALFTFGRHNIAITADMLPESMMERIKTQNNIVTTGLWGDYAQYLQNPDKSWKYNASIREIRDNKINMNQIRGTPCAVCKVPHESENPYCLISDNAITLLCPSANRKHKEGDKEINYFIFVAVTERAKKGFLDRIMDLTLLEAPPVDIKSTIKTRDKEMRAIDEFFGDKCGHLAIKSPLGSGKTKRIVDMLKRKYADGTFLMLGYRVSLSNENHADIQAAGIDVTLYSDVPRYEINDPRVICQIESLGRIPDGKTFDVVIVDETSGVLHQMRQHKPADYKKMMITFRQIISCAKKVIYIDGLMRPEILNSVRRFRKEKLEVWENLPVEKKYKEVIFSDNKQEWVDHLIELLEMGEKVWVTSTQGERFITSVVAAVNKCLPNCKVLPIYRNVNNTPVILRNLNEYVKDYQLVIASPSIEAGVSITTPFDYQFVNLTSSGPNAWSIIQMLGRVRNVLNPQVFIYVHGLVVQDLPRDYEEIYKRWEKKLAIACNKIWCIDGKEWIDGSCRFPDPYSIFMAFIVYLALDEYNGRRNIILEVIRYFQRTYDVKFYKYADSPEGKALDEKRAKETEKVMEGAVKLLGEKHMAAILAAPDIDVDEARVISRKRERLRTEEERGSITRYYLRRYYEYPGEIDKDWLTTYMKDGVRNMFHKIHHRKMTPDAAIRLANVLREDAQNYAVRENEPESFILNLSRTDTIELWTSLRIKEIVESGVKDPARVKQLLKEFMITQQSRAEVLKGRKISETTVIRLANELLFEYGWKLKESKENFYEGGKRKTNRVYKLIDISAKYFYEGDLKTGEKRPRVV